MLYQQIRPTKLSEFIGNESAKISLKRAFESEDRPHVFLLGGPSGCGKTTLARIASAELGAEDFGIVEINAASKRGIDMARELEKYARTSPMGGGARAVILDEAHALTKDAQSALLKVLEDVPEYAFYFLCTTEPHRLIKTIRTRCCKVDVNKLNDEDIAKLVDDVVERAHLENPGDEVVDAIIENADGSPREALMFLEQQDGLSEKEALTVVQSRQTVKKEMLDLCRAVVRGSWKEVVNTYKRLEDKEPEKVRRAVLGYLKSCLMKANPNEAGRFADMMEELVSNTYDSGEPAVALMIFRANRCKK